jgi:hypothetical protein
VVVVTLLQPIAVGWALLFHEPEDHLWRECHEKVLYTECIDCV